MHMDIAQHAHQRNLWRFSEVHLLTIAGLLQAPLLPLMRCMRVNAGGRQIVFICTF